jgi:hypothetical protein
MPKIIIHVTNRQAEFTECKVMASKVWRGLAVHRSVDPEHHRKWVVTHLPTGSVFTARKAIVVFRRHADAVTCLKTFARLGACLSG